MWVIPIELNTLFVGDKHRHLGAVFAAVNLFDLVISWVEINLGLTEELLSPLTMS